MRGNRLLAATALAVLALGAATSADSQKLRPGRSLAFRSGFAFLSSATPTPGVAVTDTFTQADGTSLSGRQADTGGTWNVATGTFSTAANRVYNTAATSTANNTASMASADQYAEADLYFASTGTSVTAYVSCRQTANGNNAYYFGWRASTSQLELFKSVGGTSTSLAVAPLSPVAGASYRVRVEAQGTTIRGYLNGSQVASVTDSGVTAASFAGLRTAGAAGTATTGVHFDNFSAGTL